MSVTFKRLLELTDFHREACVPYCRIVDGMFPGPYHLYEDLPYVHVSLFKELDMKSTEKVHRTLNSSGTSGKPSQIHIDGTSAMEQMKTLGNIFSARFGQKRRSIYTVSTYDASDARFAAIVGFSAMGRKPRTLADHWSSSHERDELIVGMTTDVWAHRDWLGAFAGHKPLVLHGGGWKKLEGQSVGREEFNAGIKEFCPDADVVNWFGMVEHSGVVYFDCRNGCFHEHDHGKFLVRDEHTLVPHETNGTGMLQLFSVLPTSYPGHSILTDDMVELVTECGCGNPNRAFKYVGRRKGSVARGCANV